MPPTTRQPRSAPATKTRAPALRALRATWRGAAAAGGMKEDAYAHALPAINGTSNSSFAWRATCSPCLQAGLNKQRGAYILGAALAYHLLKRPAAAVRCRRIVVGAPGAALHLATELPGEGLLFCGALSGEQPGGTSEPEHDVCIVSYYKYIAAFIDLDGDAGQARRGILKEKARQRVLRRAHTRQTWRRATNARTTPHNANIPAETSAAARDVAPRAAARCARLCGGITTKRAGRGRANGLTSDAGGRHPDGGLCQPRTLLCCSVTYAMPCLPLLSCHRPPNLIPNLPLPF